MRPFSTHGSMQASSSTPSSPPSPPPITKSKTSPPALPATPNAGTGTAFSRFISKMEFKSPAFDFGRVGGKHREECKGIVSMAGEELTEVLSSSSAATSYSTSKRWGIQHTMGNRQNNNKQGEKGRGTIIGITASGDRVHEQEDEFGLSATIQWSSPGKKPPTSSSSSSSMSSVLLVKNEDEEEKGGISTSSSPSLSDIGEGRDATPLESRPEGSDDDEDIDDEDEDEDEEGEQEEDKCEAAEMGKQGGRGSTGGFSHGQSLSFQVSFGQGPTGLVVADTKAGKGAFVESFLQIPTKNGLVPAAIKLSGRVRVGDLITHVGGTDVQFSSGVVVTDLLEKGSRPVTVSFERYLQRYSFQEVAEDPRKVPFYFKYLFTEVEDPRHEQAKVMLLIESEQYTSQHKNMTAANRLKEGRRIFDKFFDARSQFEVTTAITPPVLEKLKSQCGPPSTRRRQRQPPTNPVLRPSLPHSSSSSQPHHQGENEDGKEEAALLAVSSDMFDEVRLLIQKDIARGSYPGFCKSAAHHKMLGYLSRSPEFIPLNPMEVLEDDDMLQYFMLYLMQTRKHATLRCYLDMERFIKPRVAALESLLKQGLVGSEKLKQAVTALMQAVLRVFSLYLCNGSYMEVTLQPLTRLNQWLRNVLISRTDIARIQRRACKLATSKAAETQILGSQLLKEAHKQQQHEPDALFSLSVPDALGIGHEVLEAQRSLLRELASDVYPRFQSHPLYEELCQEIGPEWRTARVSHRPLSLRPGSIKRLLRRVKLPREFAIHRAPLSAVLASPCLSLSSPQQHGLLAPLSNLSSLDQHLRLQQPQPQRQQEHQQQQEHHHHHQQQQQQQAIPPAQAEVESPADWLMVFDTEFSPHMAIKVRTTKQIPISAYAKSLHRKATLSPSSSFSPSSSSPAAPSPLPAGIENFMVPEEFPTKLGTTAPCPILFNFLVPGKHDKPFYGACLIMYRPANEALPVDEGDLDLTLSPAGGQQQQQQQQQHMDSPLINVDLTISQSMEGMTGGGQVVGGGGRTPSQPVQPGPGIAVVESLASLSRTADSSRATTTVAAAMPAAATSAVVNVNANASRSMTSTTQSSFSSDDASMHSHGGSSISSSSSFAEQQQQQVFEGNASQHEQQRQFSAKQEMSIGYKIERGNEAQEQVKAIADSIFSSPREKDGRNFNETQVLVLAAGEAREESEEGSLGLQQLARLPVLDETMEEQEEEASPAFGASAALFDLSPPYPPLAQQPQEEHQEEQQEEQQQAQLPCWGTNSHHNASIEFQTSGDSNDGGKVEGEDDDDDESLIALVEADFQDALIQSYETFVRDSFTANNPATFEALPTASSGYGDKGDHSTAAIAPPSSYQQSFPFSTVFNPPRRGTTVGDSSGVTAVQQHRLRRGSNGFSMGTRDGLMAAAAKALPITLTYAPYGFCLISRFSFINSLRAPLAALFDPRNTRHPSALRAIQDYLAAQPPVHIPLNAADLHESLCLLQAAPAPASMSPHVAAAALSPSGLLSPSPAKPAPASTSAAINFPPSALRPPSPPQQQHQHPIFTQIDFEIETLFQCLSPRNLVLVFLALLLECKVLLISERLTLLTIAGEGFRLLLHPLKWCHVYVPLVPEVMIDHVIGCPTPFIMGIHRKTYLQRQDDFPVEIVRVDLDNDYVEAPAKDLNRKNVPFAGPLARKFERLASPTTALSDSCRWRASPAQGPMHAMTNFSRSNSSSSSNKNNGLLSSSVSPHPSRSAAAIGAAPVPWPTLQKRDTRGALLVLRDFVQGLLIGIEDSCYRICTETEVTILFDETLFGHICGPAELLLITPNEPDTDALPHSPHLPLAPPNDATAQEDFVLRFCRTQAFSNALMKSLQRGG